MEAVQNSLNFKANIATKIKGRNGIMDKISKEFENISAHMDEPLILERTPIRTDKYETQNIYTRVGSTFTIANGLKEILSKNPKNVTEKDIKNAAKRLFTNYKMLLEESKFEAEVKKILPELKKINFELSLQNLVNKNGGKPSKREILLNERKAVLQSRIEKHKARYFEAVDKYEKKGYDLDIYADLSENTVNDIVNV